MTVINVTIVIFLDKIKKKCKEGVLDAFLQKYSYCPIITLCEKTGYHSLFFDITDRKQTHVTLYYIYETKAWYFKRLLHLTLVTLGTHTVHENTNKIGNEFIFSVSFHLTVLTANTRRLSNDKKN